MFKMGDKLESCDSLESCFALVFLTFRLRQIEMLLRSVGEV